MTTIHVMRPKLPSAERLAPYLRQIDEARFYSNFGPLVQRLEARLAHRFGLPVEGVTTVANATLGLALALGALEAPVGSLCVLPAWTFIASAHAAVMAGLIPYFVDVGAANWALDPDGVAEMIAQAPARVGAVMPVAPFGAPVDVAAWDLFRVRTGLPVVIDAAAGFDVARPGAIPTVISLHATKVLGVGEGGFVMSSDASLIREIRTRSNFGFRGTREAVMPATNAKLSEYHAAVGLAALDEWTDARLEWMAVAEAYRQALPESNRLTYQPEFGQSWIASTCMLRLRHGEASRLEQALQQAGIETRRWWGEGAHSHAASAAFPRTMLPVTEELALSTIAIPFFRDLELAEVQQVTERVVAATPD